MDEPTMRLNDSDETHAQAETTAQKLRIGRDTRRVLLIVIAGFVVICILAVVFINRGGKSKDSVASGTEQTEAQKTFPITIPGNDISDVRPIGNAVCILSGDALTFVKPNGKTYGTTALSYVEPVLKTAGAYGFAYDRLSGRYALFSDKKILVQGQSITKAQITTACVADGGSYAVACRGEDGAASILTYYSKTGKVLYSWACAKEHIVSVAISSDGRRLLCAALGAESGAILTKLYLLDIYSTEIQWQYTLNDAAVIDCSFSEGNRVIAVCSDKRVILDSKSGEILSVYVYPAELLHYTSDVSYGAVIVTLKFGSFDVYEITALDNENRVIYVYETTERVVDVDLHQTRLALLTEDSVVSVNGGGFGLRLGRTSGVEKGVCCHDDRIYHFTVGVLNRS